MQRHEEMKQHRGPHTCVDPTHLRARGAAFLVLSQAPTCKSQALVWATKMSPNLIISRPIRGDFMGSINWTSGDTKREDLRDERQRDRLGDTLGLSGRRA